MNIDMIKFGNKTITDEQIEKFVDEHLQQIEKNKKEEQEIINNGAMNSIFNELIKMDSDNKFLWSDDFLYYKKEDKAQKELLMEQIKAITNKVLSYVNKYNIIYDIETDNCFLTGFALFKYNNNILYVEEMSGQGVCDCIGILNESDIKDLNIKNINDLIILDIEYILDDKPFEINNPIYQNTLNKNLDIELSQLISEYGIEKVKERIDFLLKNGGNEDEKNN